MGIHSPLIPCTGTLGRNGGSNQIENRTRKNRIMITNTRQTASPISSVRGALKSTQVAPARVSSPTPSTPQKTAPCQTVIAKRAYEIWLSQGQVAGRDQQHWFEAEQQLRHA
jgi:hypothetical protein